FPVDAVAIVKLLRADTAEVLASEVVEKRVAGDTREAAFRDATSQVAAEAMDVSIKHIARHWLEDVDQRGGQQISVVLHKFPFRRTATLVESLRKVGGVRDVIIKQTDAESTGELVVRTNASAADVGLVLTKIDPALRVVTSTENRIDVE
ncbi:MAG TPA: hypothetical protein VFC46_01100, partial [Humisphaera sp.]|nr:hypothetical protein [Humisphaera sp.]